jgi:hypothetical protein
MTEDRTSAAREKASAIKEKLDAMKLDLIDAGHKLAETGDDLYLRSVQQRREVIEALEYALSKAPPQPAMIGRMRG